MERIKLWTHGWERKVAAGFRGQHFKRAQPPQHSALLWQDNRQTKCQNLHYYGILWERRSRPDYKRLSKTARSYSWRRDMEGSDLDYTWTLSLSQKGQWGRKRRQNYKWRVFSKNSSSRLEARQHILRCTQQRENRRFRVGKSNESRISIRIYSCRHTLLYESWIDQWLQIQWVEWHLVFRLHYLRACSITSSFLRLKSSESRNKDKSRAIWPHSPSVLRGIKQSDNMDAATNI